MFLTNSDSDMSKLMLNKLIFFNYIEFKNFIKIGIDGL